MAEPHWDPFFVASIVVFLGVLVTGLALWRRLRARREIARLRRAYQQAVASGAMSVNEVRTVSVPRVETAGRVQPPARPADPDGPRRHGGIVRAPASFDDSPRGFLIPPGRPTAPCACRGVHFPSSTNCRWCKCHRPDSPTPISAATSGTPEARVSSTGTDGAREQVSAARPRMHNPPPGSGGPAGVPSLFEAAAERILATTPRPAHAAALTPDQVTDLQDALTAAGLPVADQRKVFAYLDERAAGRPVNQGGVQGGVHFTCRQLYGQGWRNAACPPCRERLAAARGPI